VLNQTEVKGLRYEKQYGIIKPGNLKAKANFETPMGRVAFYNYGDMQRQNSFSAFVMQIQDGEFQCIWPESAATASYIQ